LLHVGFKIAANMRTRYLDLLDANEAVIARNVTENLFRQAHRSRFSRVQGMIVVPMSVSGAGKDEYFRFHKLQFFH